MTLYIRKADSDFHQILIPKFPRRRKAKIVGKTKYVELHKIEERRKIKLYRNNT
jgi:hypothetical protein